jgi:competence protein ComEA
MLIIDLKGAIKLPNIYTVKEGTILYELINLAGGLDVNADVSNINLAAVLTENQMITIPYKKVNNNSQTSDLVNINTATVEELCSLPGIGTSKANSIINYRMNNGFFITINDIKKVSGIGEELFNKIKEYICV